MLELAILGLLLESPMHGYELRKRLTGLLGAPIAHSASPAMHERAAAALGLHCHYQLIEVANAGREELKMLLEGVRRLGFAGINVTFPYKEAVLDLLDERGILVLARPSVSPLPPLPAPGE